MVTVTCVPSVGQATPLEMMSMEYVVDGVRPVTVMKCSCDTVEAPRSSCTTVPGDEPATPHLTAPVPAAAERQVTTRLLSRIDPTRG